MGHQTPQRVLVTGDFVIDFHIYQGKRLHYGDLSEHGVVVRPQLGGAGVVYDLLREVHQADVEKRLSKKVKEAQAENIQLKDEELETLRSECRKEALVQPHSACDIRDINIQVPLEASQHAFSFLRPVSSGKKEYWLVSEAMGFGSESDSSTEQPTDAINTGNEPGQNLADVLTISEGGIGFRHNQNQWDSLPFETASWIVLKSASPIMEGPLWEKLTTDYSDRLIVIVSASDLRKTNARISQGLSWDATVKQVVSEIVTGELQVLSNCSHLIVSFGSEGALWLEFSGDSNNETLAYASFIFDPQVGEGDHAREVEGTAFGLLSCLTAAVTVQACHEKPDFEKACAGGLSAMRNLLLQGHGPAVDQAEGFPAKRLTKLFETPDHRYSRARFLVHSQKISDEWSILSESSLKSSVQDHEVYDTYGMARLVVQRGPIALDNLPCLSVGKLLSIDRREIENLRTLMSLMRNYRDNNKGKKPLSIGVFGPPGSGKSFSVKQLAQSICGKEGWLEFNLSQFASTADLIGAFHQIRDRVLRRILPVAFFDEFDSQELKWLQYLLAPMQDGQFQEGQMTHPIGKCIFIFAGGTSWTFDSFGPPETADEKTEKEFRLTKGPDFKSRLDGFLDVLGPNQRRSLNAAGNGYEAGEIDSNDICYKIRRALMIRAELGCAESDKLDIDDGILHALLETEKYTHGSRSLSKILQPFTNVKGKLYKSLLPPKSQIAMHTDVDQFLNLCENAPKPSTNLRAISGAEFPGGQQIFDETELTHLASAVHHVYSQKYGDGRNYEQLSAFEKESNKAAARRMIRNLEFVGMQVVHGQNDDSECYWIKRHIEYHLELLAEAEHDGWMKWHFEQGWRYAPGSKDKIAKTHPCLLPYNDLPHHEQEKDRDSVRTYLSILNSADRRISLT